jgi:hypothetical protein
MVEYINLHPKGVTAHHGHNKVSIILPFYHPPPAMYRLVTAVPIHRRPPLLTAVPTTSSPQLRSPIQRVDPFGRTSMDRRLSSPPRPGIRSIHLRWPSLGISSRVPTRRSPTFGNSKHPVSAATPRSSPRLPPERVGQREDARPVHFSRRPSPTADK